MLAWIVFLSLLIFYPVSSKSEHILSIRWLCWVVWLGNDSSSHSPSGHAAQGETQLKTAQQVLLPPDFSLSAIPGKDKAVCPWDSSTSPLVLSWREVKGVLFPEAWHHISVRLASTAISSHEGLLKAETIFCHPFPLFMAFSSPFWAPNVPASMGWRDYQEICYCYSCLGLGKRQALSRILCLRKRLQACDESLNVCVCTHHGSFLLPALAWTSCLKGTSISFPLPVSCRCPSPCVPGVSYAASHWICLQDTWSHHLHVLSPG